MLTGRARLKIRDASFRDFRSTHRLRGQPASYRTSVRDSVRGRRAAGRGRCRRRLEDHRRHSGPASFQIRAGLFYAGESRAVGLAGRVRFNRKAFSRVGTLRAARRETGPSQVGEVWVVPLFSWYCADFDTEATDADSQLEAWADFYFCRWPAGLASPAEYLLKMNEPRVKNYDAPVISFSHFLPRRDLLPPTDQLRFKGLPSVAGCRSLEQQIRTMNSHTHVFGHSHINWDKLIDGVRYVQTPSCAIHASRDNSPFASSWSVCS